MEILDIVFWVYVGMGVFMGILTVIAMRRNMEMMNASFFDRVFVVILNVYGWPAVIFLMILIERKKKKKKKIKNKRRYLCRTTT